MIRMDSATEQFLVALRSLQERSIRAHRQVSSGLRISSVSDDPGQVPELLTLQTEQSAMEQVRKNLGIVKVEIDTAENALAHSVKLLDRARALALLGASSPAGDSDVRVLANEASSLLTQMTALSQTQSAGRAVFGETEAGRLLQHPNGTTFAVAKTAAEVFEAPGDVNVFAAMESLRDALEVNDHAAMLESLGKLRLASDHLSHELVWYGGLQNRMASAIDIADKFQIQVTTRVGEIRDADLPEAITELTATQTQQQAAMSAQAQMPRLSLFDYLR